MSEQLPLSALHPMAPEFLSTAVLYTAPIDVDAAVARIGELWSEKIEPEWHEVPRVHSGRGVRLAGLCSSWWTKCLS